MVFVLNFFNGMSFVSIIFPKVLIYWWRFWKTLRAKCLRASKKALLARMHFSAWPGQYSGLNHKFQEFIECSECGPKIERWDQLTPSIKMSGILCVSGKMEQLIIFKMRTNITFECVVYMWMSEIFADTKINDILKWNGK